MQHTEVLAVRFAALTTLTQSAIDAAIELGDAVSAELLREDSRGLDKSLWCLKAHLQA